MLYADIECTSLSNKVVHLVYIYRLPNTNMINSSLLIDALERQIAAANYNTFAIIIGDCNLTKIDCSARCTALNSTTVIVNFTTLNFTTVIVNYNGDSKLYYIKQYNGDSELQR